MNSHNQSLQLTPWVAAVSTGLRLLWSHADDLAAQLSSMLYPVSTGNSR
jgi:hypothetical protein